MLFFYYDNKLKFFKNKIRIDNVGISNIKKGKPFHQKSKINNFVCFSAKC